MAFTSSGFAKAFNVLTHFLPEHVHRPTLQASHQIIVQPPYHCWLQASLHLERLQLPPRCAPQHWMQMMWLSVSMRLMAASSSSSNGWLCRCCTTVWFAGRRDPVQPQQRAAY